MEFGTVHTVFTGRFKDDLRGICNGKRHIRLTPDGSKHDLPYEVQFPGDERFFNVLWAEKIISCKKCYSNHMISKDCETVMAQQDECPDKEYTVPHSEFSVQVMGPSDPEVVTKPTISPVNHVIDTQNEMPDNPMASGLEESNHATRPVITRPVPWEDIPDQVPSDLGPIHLHYQKEPLVLMAPTATLQPHWSLQLTLGLNQAVMTLWRLQAR